MATVAAVQMTSGPEPAANLQVAARLIAEAAGQGAELVLLPECFAAMGTSSLAAIAEAEWGEARPIRRFLAAQARQHGVWLVGGSLPLPAQAGGKPMACQLVVDERGQEVARYDKLHLFDVDVADSHGSYRESRDYDFGDQVVCIDSPVGRLGLSICYDVRFPELYQALRAQGAELIVVPAAFTAVTGAAHWEVLLRSRAIETQCWVLAANQVGEHPNGRQTYGHSCLIDPWGAVQQCLAAGEGVVTGTLVPDQLQSVRERMPITRHRRFALPAEPLPPGKGV
ncbi:MULTISPECIES: carbon-nitrogen hydrolase family protein [Pseudomonadaceae]|jgi:predicted amidohydrolase|uniref:Carbon-nitrogen hydrolase n=2 Tax=Pseudomonas abyssi TaxID=170540 RepID=A0A2A3MNH0_9PSED|nr:MULTISPECIES: carbon-nitrogen hydrolase family protein [Pseudomonadaceae]MAD00425.1 carbon-nitrogen hydrolase [Pseudomonadales bacterium]MAG67894.1 carbon-nitrogen hydrolase [Pseudomonadales bacterium]PBK06154.1 carbon-nitrogen hydrolase [Pseudomonas abyssi]RGP54681.1 carbon-nitrogen hydrolase [Halopseudomonas gallaeciensis]|tara:strand:- start:57512 stop:58360 length:849 start_codon:yes stop_codon:yes gene_type:complete